MVTVGICPVTASNRAGVAPMPALTGPVRRLWGAAVSRPSMALLTTASAGTAATTTTASPIARKNRPRPRMRTAAAGWVLVTGFRCRLLMGFPCPLGRRRRPGGRCCGADAGEQPLQGEPEQVVGNPGGVEEPLPGQAVDQRGHHGGHRRGRCLGAALLE